MIGLGVLVTLKDLRKAGVWCIRPLKSRLLLTRFARQLLEAPGLHHRDKAWQGLAEGSGGVFEWAPLNAGKSFTTHKASKLITWIRVGSYSLKALVTVMDEHASM